MNLSISRMANLAVGGEISANTVRSAFAAGLSTRPIAVSGAVPRLPHVEVSYGPSSRPFGRYRVRSPQRASSSASSQVATPAMKGMARAAHPASQTFDC
jgi:hypothetical protein